MDLISIEQYDDYLEHHGIRGQKWGVRRYQNSDGTLTAEGKKRYAHEIKKGNDLRAKGSSIERETLHYLDRSAVISVATTGAGVIAGALAMSNPALAAGITAIAGIAASWANVGNQVVTLLRGHRMELADRAKTKN